MTRIGAAMAAAAAIALGSPPAGADGGADAASPCPPSARLRGDAELGRQVGLELAVLGVFSQEIPARCPSVEVTLRARGEQVSVELRDPSGRRAQQIVTNAHVAATWIESWVHPELGAPLLSGRDPAGPPPTAPAAISGVTVTGADVSARADRGPSRGPERPSLSYRGLVLGVVGEKLYASDDSEWRGLSLTACARWGMLCPGLSVHLGDDRDYLATGSWAPADRLNVDLLATLSAPIDVGRMSLTPSIGVGAGLLRTSIAPCDFDATGATCDSDEVISSFGVRAEMGIAGSFPISDRVSLLVTASLGFAPGARSADIPFETPPDPQDTDDPPPDQGDPDPADPDDPGGTDGQPPGDGTDPDDSPPILPVAIPFPGEPSQFSRIGIGLVVILP